MRAVLLDIDLVARTGGMRVLLSVLAEGPEEFAPVLVTTFLYVIDAPSTRAYLNPGTDLEIALSGITDAYGKGEEHMERMTACAKVVAAMLRTWSGASRSCMFAPSSPSPRRPHLSLHGQYAGHPRAH